ncbi:MAG: hypothetical protein Q8P67_27535, partial [archaeon]|nr:hypothetical protein [archaeon]
DDDGDDQIDEGVTSTSERDLAQLDISNHDGNHDDAPDDMVGIEDFDDGDSNSDDEGEEEEDFEVDIGTDEEAEAAAAHQPVVGNEAGHGSGDELLDMSAADVPLDENSVVLLLKQLLLTELKHHNLSPEEAREARTKFHFLKRILGRAYRHVDERNPMALNTEARIAWQAPLVVLRKSYQVMTARRPDLADPSELKHQLIQRVPWESQRVLQDFDSDGDEDTHDILPGITRDDLEDILNDSSHRVLDPDTDDGSHHHHHHHHHRHQQQQQQQQQSNSDKQYNSLLEVLGARPPK